MSLLRETDHVDTTSSSDRFMSGKALWPTPALFGDDSAYERIGVHR